MNYFLVIISAYLLNSYYSAAFYDLGSEELDKEYEKFQQSSLQTAPVAFTPTCRPENVHIFSHKTIQCACGMHCEFKCNEETAVNDKPTPVDKTKTGKNCKRVCYQKPCQRPEYHIVYDYEYSKGLCRRSNICVYKGKCQGKDHKWINYSKLSCKTLIDNPYLDDENPKQVQSYDFPSYRPHTYGGRFPF